MSGHQGSVNVPKEHRIVPCRGFVFCKTDSYYKGLRPGKQTPEPLNTTVTESRTQDAPTMTHLHLVLHESFSFPMVPIRHQQREICCAQTQCRPGYLKYPPQSPAPLIGSLCLANPSAQYTAPPISTQPLQPFRLARRPSPARGLCKCNQHTNLERIRTPYCRV